MLLLFSPPFRIVAVSTEDKNLHKGCGEQRRAVCVSSGGLCARAAGVSGAERGGPGHKVLSSCPCCSEVAVGNGIHSPRGCGPS